MIDSTNEILCHHGCGRPGVNYLKDAGYWICDSHANKCPALRERISSTLKEKYIDSVKQRMERLVAEGNQKCYICGEKANYWIGKVKKQHTFCCSDRSKKCPKFHEYMSERRREAIRNNPKYLKLLREIVKDMGKDKEIQDKKREAMLQLHNGDCDKCKDFQKNYKEGHRTYAEQTHERWSNELITKYNVDPEEIRHLTTLQLYMRCKRRREMDALSRMNNKK